MSKDKSITESEEEKIIKKNEREIDTNKKKEKKEEREKKEHFWGKQLWPQLGRHGSTTKAQITIQGPDYYTRPRLLYKAQIAIQGPDY